MAKKGAAAKTVKKAEGAEKSPAKAKVAKTEGAAGKKAHKRKSNYTSYSSYIYKVLKQVHPDTGISKKAMVVMDSFVHGKFYLRFTHYALNVSV